MEEENKKSELYNETYLHIEKTLNERKEEYKKMATEFTGLNVLLETIIRSGSEKPIKEFVSELDLDIDYDQLIEAKHKMLGDRDSIQEELKNSQTEAVSYLRDTILPLPITINEKQKLTKLIYEILNYMIESEKYLVLCTGLFNILNDKLK